MSTVVPANLRTAVNAAERFVSLANDEEAGLAMWWVALHEVARQLRVALDEALPTPGTVMQEPPPAPPPPREEVVMLEGIVQASTRDRGAMAKPIITSANSLYVGHRVLATFALPLPTRLLIPELPVFNLEPQR
jgi:hypothetical protein